MERETVFPADRGEEERWQAVTSLPPEEKHKSMFLAALGDPSWRVRKAAVEKITNAIHPEVYVEGLIEGLHAQENAGCRNACVEALVRVGRPSVRALVKASAKSDEDVRKFAADILGDIGGGEAEKGLANLLKDADENVSFASAEALGKIRSRSAQAILKQEVRKADLRPLVRLAVLEALADQESNLPLNRLDGFLADPLLAKPAVRLLGLHTSEAAMRKVCRLLDAPNETLRQTALLALDRMLRTRPSLGKAAKASLPGAAFLALSRWLESEEPPLQFGAARLAAVLGLKEFAKHILQLVSSEQGSVVAEEVYRGLGPDAVRSLVLAFHAVSPEKQAFCLRLFAAFGVAESRPLAEKGLDDPDPLIRSASARALGALAGRDDVARLFEKLCSESEESVKESILDGLVRLCGSHKAEVLEGVEKGFSGDDRASLVYVVRLLGHCGTRKHLAKLVMLLKDESPGIRREALAALARLSPPKAREQAMAFLNDDDVENRSLACRILSETGGRGATEALVRMLNDKSGWVRLEALRGLVTVGAAVKAPGSALMEKALLDPMGPVVIFAFEVLARQNRKNALRCLGPVLAHSEPRVQLEAVRILERYGIDPTCVDVRSRVGGLRDEAKLDWLRWVGRSGRVLRKDFLKEMARHEKSYEIQRVAAQIGRGASA
ncbi:MAG: HEAT repeat domain-containing protein [Nitrospirae bacterium]|nr:HEAT repeat domain-containing protein [Nitrospirota bacterium]